MPHHLADLCTGDDHVRRVGTNLFGAGWDEGFTWGTPSRSPSPELGDASLPVDVTRGHGDPLFESSSLSAKEPHVAERGSLANRAVEGFSEQWFVDALASGSLEERLQEQQLSTAALLEKFKRKAAGSSDVRVVYDGRAETAKQKTFPKGGAAADGGMESGRVRGLSGGSPKANRKRSIAVRAALKDGVSTAPVPGLAVNSELVLHEELRAVGGWRGPHACQRGAQEFDIAGRVIEEMWKLAQALLLLLLLFLSLIEVMWKVVQGASRGWFHHHRNHPHCITVTLTIVTVIMNEQEAHASEDMMDDDWMTGTTCLEALLGEGEELQACTPFYDPYCAAAPSPSPFCCS